MCGVFLGFSLWDRRWFMVWEMLFFCASMFCADARSSQFALFCAFLSNGDHGLS